MIQENRAGRILEALTLMVLCLLLLAVPWPLGARLPWAALASSTAVLALGTVWFCAAFNTERQIAQSSFCTPMAAFLGWVALQWLLGTTVYRHDTAVGFVQYSAYAVTALLTIHIAGRSRSASKLIAAVVIAAATVAIFTLVQYATWNGKLFWYYDPPFGGTSPFGPFNNRNYFVGYMLPGIAVCFAFGLARHVRWPARALAFVVGITGATAILLSRSRGGALSLAAMILLLVAVSARHRFGRTKLQRWLHPRRLITVGLLSALALAALARSERVHQGFAEIFVPRERSAIGRLQIWSDSLPMVLDAPVFGFGLNTYQWTNYKYRTKHDTSYPQHAHNEYLEMTVETGLVGAGLCAWFLVVLLGTMRKRLQDAAPGWEYATRLGALAGWAAILTLSLIDFPTVIPATNFTLAVLAALGTMDFDA